MLFPTLLQNTSKLSFAICITKHCKSRKMRGDGKNYPPLFSFIRLISNCEEVDVRFSGHSTLFPNQDFIRELGNSKVQRYYAPELFAYQIMIEVCFILLSRSLSEICESKEWVQSTNEHNTVMDLKCYPPLNNFLLRIALFVCPNHHYSHFFDSTRLMLPIWLSGQTVLLASSW